MKKSMLFFIALVLLLSLSGLSQIFKNKMVNTQKKEVKEEIVAAPTSNQTDLTGTWYWENSSNGNSTELFLTQNGNSVTGKHCSSFLEGSKLDCVKENDANSITLTMTAANVFEGTIKSAFSNVQIPILINLNPDNETIFFKQLSQPTKEYYLPNNVTMTLAQD